MRDKGALSSESQESPLGRKARSSTPRAEIEPLEKKRDQKIFGGKSRPPYRDESAASRSATPGAGGEKGGTPVQERRTSSATAREWEPAPRKSDFSSEIRRSRGRQLLKTVDEGALRPGVRKSAPPCEIRVQLLVSARAGRKRSLAEKATVVVVVQKKLKPWTRSEPGRALVGVVRQRIARRRKERGTTMSKNGGFSGKGWLDDP